MKSLIWIFASFLIVWGFQNCSKVDFEPGSAESVGKADIENAELVEVNDSEDTGIPDGESYDEEDSDEMGVSETYGPSDDMDGDDSSEEDDENLDVVEENDDDEMDDSSDPEDVDNGEGRSLYACILEGPGKSTKLGLKCHKNQKDGERGSLDEGLIGRKPIVHSVCVSKEACLGRIAKVFVVKGAYKRGYCRHNPHVRRLSDEEVDFLIDKLQ